MTNPASSFCVCVCVWISSIIIAEGTHNLHTLMAMIFGVINAFVGVIEANIKKRMCSPWTK